MSFLYHKSLIVLGENFDMPGEDVYKRLQDAIEYFEIYCEDCDAKNFRHNIDQLMLRTIISFKCQEIKEPHFFSAQTAFIGLNFI